MDLIEERSVCYCTYVGTSYKKPAEPEGNALTIVIARTQEVHAYRFRDPENYYDRKKYQG